MNGIHLLFDNETIARILKTPTEQLDLFHNKNLERIEELFTAFLVRESLQEKQIYLQSLDPDSFEMLLRTYFQIVDNSLFATAARRH